MIQEVTALHAELDKLIGDDRAKMAAAIRHLVSNLLTSPTLERANRGEAICAGLRKIESDQANWARACEKLMWKAQS
jgi:hypothetical protein